MERTGGTIATVDGGKSGLRLRISIDGAHFEGVGRGYEASMDAESDGRSTVHAIHEALESAQAASRGRLGSHPTAELAFVGLTGVPGNPIERELLELALQDRLARRVFVFDDGILAHAGALGAAGTVASVGTGTNVTTISPDGEVRSVDGWGPMIGDRGSAYAIGLAGGRAAAASLDGVSPRTGIVRHLDALLGEPPRSLSTLQRFLRRPDTTARMAAFAEVVLRLAAEGDPVAGQIEDLAAAELAATLAAASIPGYPITWSGRLLSAHPHYLNKVQAASTPEVLQWMQPPHGESLDGGLVLAESLESVDGVYRNAMVAWAEPEQ